MSNSSGTGSAADASASTDGPTIDEASAVFEQQLVVEALTKKVEKLQEHLDAAKAALKEQKALAATIGKKG